MRINPSFLAKCIVDRKVESGSWKWHFKLDSSKTSSTCALTTLHKAGQLWMANVRLRRGLNQLVTFSRSRQPEQSHITFGNFVFCHECMVPRPQLLPPRTLVLEMKDHRPFFLTHETRRVTEEFGIQNSNK